jgi:hypothetical protein
MMALCKLCEDKELSPRSKLDTCSNCRASMGVWSRRTAAEVLNRRRKLHIYDMRMELVVLHPGNLKAKPIPKPFLSATALKKQVKSVRKQEASHARA